MNEAGSLPGHPKAELQFARRLAAVSHAQDPIPADTIGIAGVVEHIEEVRIEADVEPFPEPDALEE
jgi:hypothetical protein